jgi:alpha-galactosidase
MFFLRKITIIILAIILAGILNGCVEMKEERISKVEIRELKEGLLISNPYLTLKYDFDLGLFELKIKNMTSKIKNATSSFIANDKRIYSRNYQERKWKDKIIKDEIGKGKEIELIFTAEGFPTLIQRIKVYEDKEFLILRSGIKNTLRENLLVTEFRPLEINPKLDGIIELGSPPSDWRALLDGYGSWEYAGIRSFSKDSSGKSWWIQSIVDPITYTSFTSGSLTALTWKTSLNHKMEREAFHWWVQCGGEGERINLLCNQSTYSEEIFVCLSTNPFESLEEWGRLTSKINHAIPLKEPPKGWCSWYHYFGKVDEKAVLKNAGFIKENLKGLGYKYIQIDDGWQKAWGNWEANSKFPSGMKGIAKELHRLGFKAGLWLAPFLVEEKLSLPKEHPDWLLRDQKGNLIKYNKPLGPSYYCLDVTHPEVQEWLSSLFAEIKDWGYDYLKLDFLFAGAYEGMHWNKPATGVKALREGLEIIRKSIGDDTYILACGAPLLPMVGIANGNRIGPDISYEIFGFDIPIWPFVKWQARNVATRYFMNGQLFNNDPDVTLVRALLLSLEEAKTLVNLDILCNGVLMLGDKLFSLPSERVALLANKEILNLTDLGKTARPIDLFEHPDESLEIKLFGSSIGLTSQLPELWDLEIDENIHVIGIFNWGDKANQISLDFAKIGLTQKRYRLWDLWEGKEIGNYKNSYTVLLDSHTSRVIKISLS